MINQHSAGRQISQCLSFASLLLSRYLAHIPSAYNWAPQSATAWLRAIMDLPEEAVHV